MITKPMLAGKLESVESVKYPVYATPKLDGIRCLKVDGKAVSRSFKPIANVGCRKDIEKYFPDGVDGELMVAKGTFQEASSAVMTEDGTASITYFVFDYVREDLECPYTERMKHLRELGASLVSRGVPSSLYKLILPVKISSEAELREFEEKCLADGYEGVMLRTGDSPYKCGRSSSKEAYLLKLKRFNDAEAVIVGFEERMHNGNEAKKDAFGRTERSSHQENMVPTGMLGSFLVKSQEFANEFSIGTGLTEEQRVAFWKTRDELRGKLVKFKYQPYGVKDVPRFPVFIGVRDTRDLD